MRQKSEKKKWEKSRLDNKEWGLLKRASLKLNAQISYWSYYIIFRFLKIYIKQFEKLVNKLLHPLFKSTEFFIT